MTPTARPCPLAACRTCTGCAHGHHDQCRGVVSCPSDHTERACRCCGRTDHHHDRQERHMSEAQRGHFVADPLTGRPLPTEPPTEAEAAAEQAALDVPIGVPDVVNVRCTTCKSGRSFPQPPYPVTVQHACDMVEPGRAFWSLLPETYQRPAGSTQ